MENCREGGDSWLPVERVSRAGRMEGSGQLFFILSENQIGRNGFECSPQSFPIKRIMNVTCSSERSDFLVMLCIY